MYEHTTRNNQVVILWLNEYKVLFLNEKPKKLVNMEGYIINNCIIVTIIIIKWKQWLLICKNDKNIVANDE